MAAEVHLRASGSADRAVPVLAELAGPTPVGLHALRALAEAAQAPEDLRPTLRACAFSPRRLMCDSPFSGPRHPDEELRAVAFALLATG
ncbi:hypothetical protein [Streptomyces sedi]|uniref:Uncharacterized protein n=1 Tax=Streptomyces sedi TaxID=555059 RepID=A0A5C4UQI9_9ACTN|nr:hypothetical protein [Streptomyces sedi]TNM25756.1 hypothetical protein FH715_26045 [Streptomyces sedi]